MYFTSPYNMHHRNTPHQKKNSLGRDKFRKQWHEQKIKMIAQKEIQTKYRKKKNTIATRRENIFYSKINLAFVGAMVCGQHNRTLLDRLHITEKCRLKNSYQELVRNKWNVKYVGNGSKEISKGNSFQTNGWVWWVSFNIGCLKRVLLTKILL